MKRALPFVVGLVFAALVAFEIVPWRCPIALVFGVPCPTCGITRAIRCVLHADFAGAFHFYPLWPGIFLAAAIAAGEIFAWKKRALHVAGLALAALAFVVWIARFFGAFGGPAPV